MIARELVKIAHGAPARFADPTVRQGELAQEIARGDLGKSPKLHIGNAAVHPKRCREARGGHGPRNVVIITTTQSARMTVIVNVVRFR